MTHKTNACQLSRFRAGDEILFQFEGLLPATVERVSFEGGIRYHVTASLSFEVLDSQAVCLAGEVEGQGAGGQ